VEVKNKIRVSANPHQIRVSEFRERHKILLRREVKEGR